MEISRVMNELNFKIFMENIDRDILSMNNKKVYQIYRHGDHSVDNIVLMAFITENYKCSLTVSMFDGSRFDLNTLSSYINFMGLSTFMERDDVNINMHTNIDNLSDGFNMKVAQLYTDIINNINSFISSDSKFVDKYLTSDARYDSKIYNILDDMSVNHARAVIQNKRFTNPLHIRMNFGHDTIVLMPSVCSHTIYEYKISMIYIRDNNALIGSDYIYSELLTLDTHICNIYRYIVHDHLYLDKQPSLLVNDLVNKMLELKLEIEKEN